MSLLDDENILIENCKIDDLHSIKQAAMLIGVYMNLLHVD